MSILSTSAEVTGTHHNHNITASSQCLEASHHCEPYGRKFGNYNCTMFKNVLPVFKSTINKRSSSLMKFYMIPAQAGRGRCQSDHTTLSVPIEIGFLYGLNFSMKSWTDIYYFVFFHVNRLQNGQVNAAKIYHNLPFLA